MTLNGTILAIASPAGQSLRGIIRISGSDAFSLLEAASDERAETPSSHANSHSSEEDGGDARPVKNHVRAIDRTRISLRDSSSFSALALRFPAPHSYTGEESLELQLPGNPALLDRVIEALIAIGQAKYLDVRRAEPGEFTARAFLNGRLDLTQAEGVAATIAAQSDAELAAAHMLTSGRLATLARELADSLASALALVEAGIDFTDQDDVVAIPPRDLHARLIPLRDRLHRELARSVGIEQLRAIPWVVLVGEPNAGKSALFNALLGRERAVVSNIAGTTRDVLAEPLTIETHHGKAEVMLVDLAGLDDADDSSMNTMMQSAARNSIERAELVLRCVPPPHETSKSPFVQKSKLANELVVHTKSDLTPTTARGVAHASRQPGGELHVSALTGSGLPDLCRAIADRLSDRAVSLAAGALALQPRHESALRTALASIEAAIALIEPQRDHRALADSELVAANMRLALDELASIAGEMTPDDILGRIFATFCIGK